MNNILNEKYIVISVMGPHAGESEDKIFKRKIEDINRIGKTFWLIKSYQAKPDMVQRICENAKTENKNVFCVFINASSVGGATPTKIASSAKSYSKDRITWNNLPMKLSPVTGKIDRNTYALILNYLDLLNDKIDLWYYAHFFNQEQPLKILQGGSTLCAIKKDMSNYNNKIKSRYREIIAIGKLCEPFCVWLR